MDKQYKVKRISKENEQFFFGYYDLQPFNKDNTLHLAHRTDFADRLQIKGDKCDIGVIDIHSLKYEKITETKAWNFQQGAMLQWNPEKPSDEIIYNDVVDGEYAGVIYDITNGRKRFLDRPVANVSKDGKYALSINFSRMYDFRPGYGYAYKKDEFFNINHPENDGVYLTDMRSGKSKLILSLEKLWQFTKNYFDGDRKLVINHITFNPDATRFVLLVRNFKTDEKPHKTAVVTADLNGENLFLLSDYGYFSHYFWVNNNELIAYADGKELKCADRIDNYLLKDLCYEGYKISNTCFLEDNHMSLTDNGKYLLNDTYPDKNRNQKLCVYDIKNDTNITLGSFYSIETPVIDIRCDLHPRWSRDNKIITFDSTHEGFRGIYAVELER